MSAEEFVVGVRVGDGYGHARVTARGAAEAPLVALNGLLARFPGEWVTTTVVRTVAEADAGGLPRGWRDGERLRVGAPLATLEELILARSAAVRSGRLEVRRTDPALVPRYAADRTWYRARATAEGD